ncbi:MAG: ABC transporter substrate-binding protein [Candidatus Methylomirabilales bacterium]
MERKKNLESSVEEIDRRQFLKTVGVATGFALTGGIPAIVAAQKAPAFPKGMKLHLLQWSSFVKPADGVHRQLAKAFQKLTGVEVTIETIDPNDLQPRTATAVESGTGPDIIQMLHNWPHRYANALADADDVAEAIGKRDGGYYDQIKSVCKVGGRWKAVPFCFVPLAVVYRTDWFREIGLEKFPETWDEYRQVGIRLKAKGRPFGQAFGHSFGDPNAFVYPLLWSFGGKETEPDGKTIALVSKETEESIKFCVALFKDALDEGGVAWDDTSNNRAYLAQTISATLNGASIYFIAKKKFPDIAKLSSHAPLPQGPAGRFHWHITQQHAIMKYSKSQQAAKEYLRWLMDREQWAKWFRVQEGYSTGPTKFWEKDKMWGTDPKIVTFRDINQYGRHTGYAGPPTAHASQALVKYIVVDMYAKAILGISPKEAIKWAVRELKQIYKA